MKIMGRDGVMINRETIDLRYLEQLSDSEQTAALGACVQYAEKHLFDGKRDLRQTVEELEKVIEKGTLAGLCESRFTIGAFARPRKQEIFFCFNRYRSLKL